MKIVNPIGRTVSRNANNDIQPNACMCRSDSAFASAQGGSYDTCDHCGCNCSSSSANLKANRSTASKANRIS